MLQGNDFSIESLTISVLNGQLDMTATLSDKKHELSILFLNVSSLCLRDISYPICLECIEIIDYSSRGWMPEVKYLVHDIEDDHMNFYCQEIINNEDKNKVSEPNFELLK